jgi:hypothetical protein
MEYDDFDWDQPQEGGEEAERAPDPAVERARPSILSLFSPPPGPLLYQIQVAVQLEQEFFHWITIRALRELEGLGELKAEALALGLKVEGREVRVRFYRRRSYRNWRREAERKLELVGRYSSPDFVRGLGAQGEMMVDAGLGGAGFRVLGRDVRAFDGVEWTQTSHNLDRVYERDGVRYGAEIKNTLSYIDRGEFEVKLAMCQHLRLRPLFIARFLPKSYMHDLWRAGGFGLLFKYQLYPHGSGDFAREVREALGLPVDSPQRLEDGTIRRFVGWHERNLGRNVGGYP